ncbi:MAG TPA: PEP-CTERM sorting domain-containing protein [Phycisphaerales bacterium]|nr:PEP-CTERM sorting domain-containing protein [Phycisphaerales bacterium]
MKKLMFWVLVLAVGATASASIMVVERADGHGPDSRDPIGDYEPGTAPLTGSLQNGEYVFSDRTFWWNNVPNALVGSEYVRTFNNDKEDAAIDVVYTLTLSETATVWIAFEERLLRETTNWRPLDEPITPWGHEAPESAQVLADWLTRHIGPAGTFTDTGLTMHIEERSTPGDRARLMLIYAAELPAGSYDFTWQANRNISNYTLGVIPEPATLSLLGLGALALVRRRR